MSSDETSVMADHNITRAIQELQDKRRPWQRKRRDSKRREKSLPYRPRSFDMFYTFGVALLALSLLAQIVVIVLFS